MKKLTWRRILNRKGVSPIIGMVLISAVLFSILALLVIWTASQEELKIQRQRERIQQLELVEGESVNYLDIPAGDLNGLNITIYNNGSVRPSIENVFVNDANVSFSVSWDTTNARKGYITINESTGATTNSIKVESELGNLYSYFQPSAVIEILSISDYQDEVRVLLDGTGSTAVGSTIYKWEWTINDGAGTTLDYFGSRVDAKIPKKDNKHNWTISLTVTDTTDGSADRTDTTDLMLALPGKGESGEGGEGYPGFGGEGAPGGIYISLGGTGGGTSIAEGREISFSIKNFSGRMIPLTSLRFYGVKSPSNYTVNTILICPANESPDAGNPDHVYYQGSNIPDGGIAEFDKPYYLGDRDEVNVKLEASSGGNPDEGDNFLVILYDAATPQNYYPVTIPIRTLDDTDDILFATNTFQVIGSGDVLKGKSLDLDANDNGDSVQLMSIGVAFSSPDDETDPCEDRLLRFKVAGVAIWEGSIASGSDIFFGTDTDADGVPDTGTTWTNSRSIEWEFNFNDVSKRFYYFVYRFSDGSAVAHKIPRFEIFLATGEPERQDTTSSGGGTYTWDIELNQIDTLTTPVNFTLAGLPCFCTATFSPSSQEVYMPDTLTLTIEVLPGAPTGLYPIVITATNNLNSDSCEIYLFIANS
jgi:hypothetical protein